MTAYAQRSLVREYWTAVYAILSRPTDYFRKLPRNGSIAGALAFALVSHWLGSALAYLWKLLIGGHIKETVAPVFQLFIQVLGLEDSRHTEGYSTAKDQIVAWIWGSGPVIMDPFFALVKILFTAFFVFAGARILVPAREKVDFESAIRVVAYGMTPAILAGLPIFGGPVSTILVMIVTVIAAREMYRIPTSRAVVVGLFPQVLFLAIIAAGAFFFLVLAFKIIASALV